MKDVFRNIRDFWKIVTCAHNPKFVFSLILNIVVRAALPFPAMFLSQQIFDFFGSSGDLGRFAIIAVTWVAIGFALNYADTWLEEAVRITGERLVSQLSVDFSAKSMNISYEQQSHPETLELRELAQKIFDGGTFSALINTIKPMIVSLIRLLLIAAMFFQLDILIIIAVIVLSLINTITNNLTKKVEYDFRIKIVPLNRKLKYLQRIASVFEYGKEMRVNSFSKITTEKIKETAMESHSFLKKILHRNFHVMRIGHTTNAIQDIIVYLLLGFKVLSKKISIGDFSLYFNAIGTFKEALVSIMSEIADMRINGLYLGHFLEYMALPDEMHSGNETAEVQDYNELTFDHVSFRYPGQDVYSVKDVSFTLRRGEKVAFVGTNGAGKTTVVKLMLRLYRPTEGRILLNGININELDYEEYLRQFAVVFQDYKLFAYTIRENICKDDIDNDSRLDALMQEVGLLERIRSLPNDYDTNYSRDFDEAGVEFSGGESQKLAIARAQYKNSQIVIMDEPTSAMDPLAEAEVYRNFDRLTQGRTAVYISHRLSSCRFCDTIYTMRDGAIEECGSHDQLIRKAGLYAEMFQAQAQYYVDNSKTAAP